MDKVSFSRISSIIPLPELLDMQKKLEALSFEDGLTGAWKRPRFDKHLATEWERASRTGQLVTVLPPEVVHGGESVGQLIPEVQR